MTSETTLLTIIEKKRCRQESPTSSCLSFQKILSSVLPIATKPVEGSNDVFWFTSFTVPSKRLEREDRLRLRRRVRWAAVERLDPDLNTLDGGSNVFCGLSFIFFIKVIHQLSCFLLSLL
jgi:hypothetical protein